MTIQQAEAILGAERVLIELVNELACQLENDGFIIVGKPVRVRTARTIGNVNAFNRS